MILPSQVKTRDGIHYHKWNYDPDTNILTCVKCNSKAILGKEPKVVNSDAII